MQNDQALFQQAVQYYQSKDLASAENTLRQILANNPKHAPSLHVMGVIALDVQRFDIAEELVRSAISYQDNVPNYHFTLGRVLVRLEKKDEAEKSYKKAISLKPDFVDALNNLATILLSSGRQDEALKILNDLLKANPNNLNALCNVASILHNKGDLDESLKYYQKAQSLDPHNAQIYYDIGRIFGDQNSIDEALDNFKRSTDLNPDHVESVIAIADIYRNKGEYDQAVSHYERAKKGDFYEYSSANIVRIYYLLGKSDLAMIEAENAIKQLPDSVPTLNNLGTAYYRQKRYRDALACYDKALSINPNDPEVYSNLAIAYKDLGRTEESIEAQKKSLELAPNVPHVYSNLLLTMIYAQSVTAEELAETARQFGRNVADPLIRNRPFKNDKSPQRKLKIGYMSPDYRSHAVRYFLPPVYHHDRDFFEIYAYSKVVVEDSMTDHIKTQFDHWRDLRLLSDDQAADLIESDGIDILVDIAGHTAHNGLMIFARKPAPIQITWLGYTATTGMKAMDYRFTDAYAEPVGMTEYLNTEELWRLPDIFCCYGAGDNSPDVIDHPPCEDNGYITFGCFNNFTKVTDDVLSTWAEILNKVPGSRLLMEIPGIHDPAIQKNIEDRFVKLGMPLDRIRMEPQYKFNQYVLYNSVDICLDPFPCVGGTTSMDTLWMGVPFVTLAGRSFSARMGVTILSNVGLSELVAQNKEDYIKIAVDLAQDRERLHTMRHGLRERTAKSPLMDQQKFTQSLEDAYRGMWKIWTEKN